MSDLTEIIFAFEHNAHQHYDENDESKSQKLPLEFTTDGFNYKLYFCGNKILDSNDEYRIFDEEYDVQEEWVDCIKRLMKEHLEYLRKVG